MSHVEVLALLSSLPGMLGFLTATMAWLKSRQTKDDIVDLHASINSKMDRLIAALEEAAHAKGVQEGMAQAKADSAAADHAVLEAIQKPAVEKQ